MLSSINTIADVETLYARLGERDYEAVMSYLADDIVWIPSRVESRLLLRSSSSCIDSMR